MNLNLNGAPKKDPRTLAIGLAIAAAVLLAFAAFSRTWVARPNSIGFGPMGCTSCNLETDGNMSNGAFIEMLRGTGIDEKFTSGAFAPMGWATFALCLIGALGLLGGAALAYKKKRPDWPMAPTTAALMATMLSLITGCVFVATKPGGPGFVGVSLGFWAFGVGAVMGIVAAQMLAKINRPVDPDLLDGAMDPEQY
ncbi:MAG: hypothetical protein H0T42_12825 [Deltaproteobacteria bacterium]|nr:hypothetical protein [Deltaproteobacteria bacterium]